jgi:dihydroorotase-like cyclic amidohydrolase
VVPLVVLRCIQPLQSDENSKVLMLCYTIHLRTKPDRLAAIAGIMDNTIDMITSDHNPIDIEHKKMEFDIKKWTIGLESALAP